MKPNELDRAVSRGDLPELVCLWGEEGFLLERAARKILALAVEPEARDFNLQVFYGKEANGEEIFDAARTLPVFSPRRLVWIKNLHELPAAEQEILLPYLQDPAPETILMGTAGKIDGRRKFFQEFKKRGKVVEFKRLYPDRIPGFVVQQVRDAGYRFTEDGLTRFCRRTGTNLAEIQSELEKLISFMGDRTLVDEADVEAVVSDIRHESVFALTDALGRREAGQALHLLHRLLEEGAVPLVILTMVVRHFRQLWKIRELQKQGVSRRDLPRQAGVNPYFLDGLVAQARRFTPEQLRRMFELFLEADLGLKSSGVHAAALLDNLVLEITREEPERPRG